MTLNESILQPNLDELLLVAAGKGNLILVKFLIRSGADIESTDDDGRTALHLAVRARSRNVIKFLLAKGASYNIRDRYSMRATTYAVATGDTDLFPLPGK